MLLSFSLIVAVASSFTVSISGQDVEEMMPEEDDQQLIKMYTPAFLIDIRSTDINYSMLSKAPFTYIVIDPDLISLTVDELSDLRAEGKIILAYMSIGEAEMGRTYWNDGDEEWMPGVKPRFLERVNPHARDRYRVRFWMPEWQTLLKKYYLANVIRRGFSGVFLAGMDAYEYFEQRERPSAGADMISLVATLRGTSQTLNGDFLQFSNNAVDLYGSERYSGLIDGMVAENIWFEDDIRRTEAQTNFTVQFLRQARADGKTVLAADFPLNQAKVCEFYVKCTTEVFRCAVFDSRLNGAGRSCQ
ncbi:hypothetical protein BV898_15848 [Hypsibius exemplaris]|uniref:Glycoside-hydrolase family GH114 TIM-barrel domain-containing protein n=1 Tax=Hypsibius exemplaris TaxID=2072580 RepID=A0A9X6NC19_HYPEX|nr:hypothetical protein BV898_15848 [Hypsibius exemplaris]